MKQALTLLLVALLVLPVIYFVRRMRRMPRDDK
jgi:hypothetical protein